MSDFDNIVMEEKLVLTGLSKTYPNTAQLQVLNGLQLKVGTGEFLSVLGLSGSGKSTLLRIIAGFEAADSGEIRLNDQPVTAPSADRVMIFQDFNQLFPWKTILDNVIFPLAALQKEESVAARCQRARHYLQLAGLEGFEHYYPHQLSGGMKQKAAIARALALEPEVLLMDEPFSSLDAQTRHALQNHLLQIWQDTRVTILFVTHDIPEAIYLSDRIAVLDQTTHTIGAMINNSLLRPRNPGSDSFLRLTAEIYGLLR